VEEPGLAVGVGVACGAGVAGGSVTPDDAPTAPGVALGEVAAVPPPAMPPIQAPVSADATMTAPTTIATPAFATRGGDAGAAAPVGVGRHAGCEGAAVGALGPNQAPPVAGGGAGGPAQP
jgi:hypothetical protein